MSYNTIMYEKEDGFCIITLNRPGALNALNQEAYRDLGNALDDINKDDNIRAFVITGAPRPDGRPCFCSGADLKEMASRTVGGRLGHVLSPTAALWAQRKPRVAWEPLFENIAWSPKISIAAIDGVCTAGGTELALSCDLILVAETAQISDMHVKNLGWIGGAAATANMAWRVGVAKAIELCCTGDVIDGKEAHRIGFANQVFPSGKLLVGAKELAKKIGGMRLAAITMVKATCRTVQDMDRRSSWYYTDDATAALWTEPDADDYGPERWLKKR
jgi:enoyl-CoA hydratase